MADRQVVLVTLLYVLVDPLGDHVVVVALFHGGMLVVDGDPLQGCHPYPYPLTLLQDLGIHILPLALLAQQLLRFSQLDDSLGHLINQGFEEGDVVIVLGLLLELEVDDAIGKHPESVHSPLAQGLGAGVHLLLTYPVSLILPLISLPRQSSHYQKY